MIKYGCLIPFLCIFLLDSLSYLMGFYLGVAVPLGFFGYLLGFFYFFLLVNKDRRNLFFLCGLSFFLIWFYFSVLLSEHYEPLDLFYSIKVIGYFGVGVALAKYSNLASENNFFVAFVLFILIILVGYFCNAVIDMGESEFNYLRIADAVAISGFFLISLMRNKLYSILCFLLVSSILFMAGSRYSFFAFVFTYLVVVFLLHFEVKGKILALSLLSLGVTITYTSFTEIESKNRIVNLVISPTEDSSYTARKYLNDIGDEVIYNNLFTGDFGYYRAFGEGGGYIHNVKSYVADFGLIGLMFITMVLTYFLYFIFKSYLHRGSQNIELTLYFLLYVLVGILFAKSWNYYPLFFCLGFCFSFFNGDLKIAIKNK